MVPSKLPKMFRATFSKQTASSILEDAATVMVAGEGAPREREDGVTPVTKMESCFHPPETKIKNIPRRVAWYRVFRALTD
jgi:hypothetical protein